MDLEAGIFSVSVDGLPKLRLLEDVREGEMVDGTVSGISNVGVLVDIGCEINALLPCGKDDTSKLKLHEELTGLEITKVNVVQRKVTVSFSGLSKLVSGLSKLVPDRPEPHSTQTESAKQKSRRLKVRTLRPDRKSLKDLRVGETLEGKVVRTKLRGGIPATFELDAGYERNASVLVRASDLVNGQNVTATVEKVNSETGLFTVSINGLPKLRFLEDFEKGEMVDGIVSRINSAGVFVDIGCKRKALLLGTKDVRSKLEPRQELKGLRVEEVDIEQNHIAVSCPGLSRRVSGRQESARRRRGGPLRAARARPRPRRQPAGAAARGASGSR
ncbi:unnamed protein product [Prorocentrum cordatum]|uniref:S1 motif domain-containing protein n=1 Tax=Prorocentrum cordatum TaxID=2364126 RepID=A0ABN9UEK7_9DINO|nr:unnamed protein product [Polarella glacialis]